MMAGEKADVLLLGPKKSLIVDALSAAFNLHIAADAKDFDAFTAELAPRIRAIAHQRHHREGPRRLDGAVAAARNHFDLRRRL